jgi:hypothetical protein
MARRTFSVLRHLQDEHNLLENTKEAAAFRL